jgi:hypothetical protein
MAFVNHLKDKQFLKSKMKIPRPVTWSPLVLKPRRIISASRWQWTTTTSEAVKTRFGSNSEFFSQTKWVFAQNYELHSLYLLENVRNMCKAIFSEMFGHNDFESKSST